MLLTNKVVIQEDEESTSPEDYLYTSLTTIFPDDTHNQHGDPGQTVVYKSSRFGDIKLTLADPKEATERSLFAHYLWNAGVYLAEVVSAANDTAEEWNVKGEKVIELGAGLGLGGIVSSLCGAEETVISDYPAPVILDNLQKNVNVNVPKDVVSRPVVRGHEWGVLDDDFSIKNKGRFARVLAADCFWMPWQHQNLARSMLHFLSGDENARVYAIGGFHTGRAKLAPFFDVAEQEGLEVEFIQEEDVEGNVRPWMKERDGGREDVTGRKRWLVTARLKRRRHQLHSEEQ